MLKKNLSPEPLKVRKEEMGSDFLSKLFRHLGSAWTASVHHLMGKDALSGLGSELRVLKGLVFVRF